MNKANNVLSIEPQIQPKTPKKWCLSEHLTALNEGAKVKLRTKKTPAGKYSFYLELNRNGKQKKVFLKLYYYGKRNTKRIDKEALIKAEQIQKKRDSEFFQNKHGFEFLHERQSESFLKFFEKSIAYNGLENKPRNKHDAKCWQHTFKHLNIYLNGEDLSFEDVNTEFCEKFTAYLNTNLAPNTAHNYLHKLKACLNYAVKKDILIKNPAQFIKISKAESKREFLTFEEIQKLNNTPCVNEQTKRAFLFSCFTGLRISDIKKLIWQEVQGEYIDFIQQKTSGVQRLKLAESAMAIINKQRTGTSQPEDKVFNLIADNKAVKHIKRWTNDAGIHKPVTWHTGRHTFACLALASGIDIYTVSKLLGHKDVKVTQIYAKIIDSEKDKAIDKLPAL